METSLENLCISKETADMYVNDWKNGNYLIQPSNGPADTPSTPLALDAFVFSFEDFKQFVERVEVDPLRKKITGVVCRLGIKKNPTGDNPPMVPCLIFEAVKDFNPATPIAHPGEMVGDLVPLPPTPLPGPIEDITARYDFSYPCPPTCPK